MTPDDLGRLINTARLTTMTCLVLTPIMENQRSEENYDQSAVSPVHTTPEAYSRNHVDLQGSKGPLALAVLGGWLVMAAMRLT